jgi:hypothetical protein
MAPDPSPPIPSFDDVMRNVRNASKTLCYAPSHWADQVHQVEGNASRRPNSIQTWDNFPSMSLQQLHDKADKIDSESANTAFNTLQKVSSRIDDAFARFQTKIRQAPEHWEGDLARTVLNGTTNYANSSDGLVNVLTAHSYLMADLGDAVAKTKSSVPSPPKPSAWDDIADLWDDRNDRAYSEAKQHAVTALSTLYQPGLSQADAPPAVPAPHDPLSSTSPGPGGLTGGDGTSPSGVGGSGSTNAAPGGAGSDGSAQNQQPSSDPTGASNPTSGHGGGASDSHAGGSRAGSSSGSGHNVSAASAMPLGDATGGGAGLGFGDGGSGSGYGGSEGGGAGGPLASPLLGTAGQGSAGAGARPLAAAAGRPGMGMPGLPAAGKKKDEEREHRTPSYLINLDNGNELIGPMPKATPPVIGLWNDDGTPKHE